MSDFTAHVEGNFLMEKYVDWMGSALVARLQSVMDVVEEWADGVRAYMLANLDWDDDMKAKGKTLRYEVQQRGREADIHIWTDEEFSLKFSTLHFDAPGGLRLKVQSQGFEELGDDLVDRLAARGIASHVV